MEQSLDGGKNGKEQGMEAMAIGEEDLSSRCGAVLMPCKQSIRAVRENTVPIKSIQPSTCHLERLTVAAHSVHYARESTHHHHAAKSSRPNRRYVTTADYSQH